MELKVFVDESGDLGWILDKEFRQGGSSKFLTIAYLILPANKNQLPKRLVKNFYKKYKININKEKKGSELTDTQRELIVEETIKMLTENKDFIMGTLTVKKEKVQQHIKEDGNKLYNYMMNLVILPKVASADLVKLIRDQRSIKVKSGNSCADYLQMQLMFEHNSKTKLIDIPTESHNNLTLLFVDWISNTIWKFYEDKDKTYFDRLKKVLDIRELFW